MNINDSLKYPQRNIRHKRKKSNKLLFIVFLLIATLATLAFVPSTSDTLYYSSGSVKYIGQRDNSLATGYGTYYYTNGISFYQGYWLNGYAHGEGDYFTPNGDLVYSGQWENGLITGYGTEYYNDGSVKYQGQWLEGAYHGDGTKFTQDNMKIYTGEWNKGIPHGQGQLFDIKESLIYSGDMQNALRHGQGKEYFNGKLHYEGQWENDEILDYSGFHLPQGQKLSAALGQHYYEIFNKLGYEEAVTVATSLLPHSQLVESSSNDNHFKYLMYRYLEFPSTYNSSVVRDIIKELQSVPITILEDLVQRGVKHRLINGSIANQPEFRSIAESMRGVPLKDALGIASPHNRLLITRLDRGNPTSTTIHELGHGVDFFLIDNHSQTEAFEKLRSEEAASMFNNSLIDTSYFVDYPEEYFAEFFTQFFISDSKKLTGGARNNSQIQQRAPKTYQYFTEKILNYQSQYYQHQGTKSAATTNPISQITANTESTPTPLYLEQTQSILINLIGKIRTKLN
ncbi:hypothetical protein HYG86_18015 [Alkalicella caledoniensis]|uniref:ATLF-like domain-containing protein n=1 Tax=Alkalicella caledoniensis TaxID=2731377 RepID=A0A7G9WCX1_ALKCA|nr:hypothetical protein [Alkalicella caledoniensis]QNO16533.1 hypothetical protein HYG86_18015 [Alkalicella caledoniensis]